MEDSPGLDVGDGPLDHLADPVDALVGLLRRLAQLAVGGLLVGRDHPPSDIALVGDPPGGIDSLEQSGRSLGRPRRAWTPGRGRRPAPDGRPAGPGSGRSCRSPCAHRDHNSR